jgi:hypothetical protein
VLINVIGVLVGIGLGLFFSFHALLGTPGMRDEEPQALGDPD